MGCSPAAVSVLVIEDELVIRSLIHRMLELNGFAVFEASTGRQALDILESQPEIALAIVDMVMPGMSGLDVAAEMSRCHPHIKILYTTGYVASIAIQAIADHHPDAVLLKPFTEPQLLSRINRLLGFPDMARDDDSYIYRSAAEPCWERLIEGSDLIPFPYRIASYRDTSAAFSIAAAHAAVLREAEIPYQIAPHADPALPFQLLAPADQRKAALDSISLLGLSVDIAIAA